MKPRPTKPMIIIAQVDGSGTSDGELTPARNTVGGRLVVLPLSPQARKLRVSEDRAGDKVHRLQFPTMNPLGRGIHERGVMLGHITGGANRAWIGAAIDGEAAGAKKNLPLFGRGAAKSLLLSGGLPEAQRVVSARRQTVDDLVERSLEGRIAVSLDEVSTGRRISERTVNGIRIAGAAGLGGRAGSVNRDQDPCRRSSRPGRRS